MTGYQSCQQLDNFSSTSTVLLHAHAHRLGEPGGVCKTEQYVAASMQQSRYHAPWWAWREGRMATTASLWRRVYPELQQLLGGRCILPTRRLGLGIGQSAATMGTTAGGYSHSKKS